MVRGIHTVLTTAPRLYLISTLGRSRRCELTVPPECGAFRFWVLCRESHDEFRELSPLGFQMKGLGSSTEWYDRTNALNLLGSEAEAGARERGKKKKVLTAIGVCARITIAGTET